VGVDIAPDGSAAVVVTESGRAVLVRAVDDGAMETRELPGSGHRYGGFPLGSTRSVCLAGDRGQVRILDPANGEAVMVSGELGTPLDWVSASPDGRRLLAVGDGDPLFVLDSETGELLRTLNPAEDVDRVSVRRGP
jgi:hypothetical protein